MEITRSYPALVVFVAYIPLKMPLWYRFRTKEEVALLEAMAEMSNKKLDDCKTKDDFWGSIVLVPMDADKYDPESISGLAGIGFESIIHSCEKYEDGYKVVLEAVSKVDVKNVTQERPYMRADATRLHEFGAKSKSAKQIRKEIYKLLDKLVKYEIVPAELQTTCKNIRFLDAFADFFIWSFGEDKDGFTREEQAQLTQELSVPKRLDAVYVKFSNKIFETEEGAKLDAKVAQKINEENKQRMRQHLLHERQQKLENELREMTGDGEDDTIGELEKRIEEAGMPKETYKVAKKELARLKTIRGDSMEFTIAHDYIDRLCSYPWNISTEDNFDLPNARGVLDEGHYGLKQVKKRIIEYLAVRKLNPKKKGGVICFDGPPGTGKTSIVKDIARAIGRKHVRISLGGVDDEAKIRGHKRTYIGALPGCIVKAMIDAGTNNPVLHFDEIDKIRPSMRGDPSAALLEVLDPEQNHAFSDNYFGVGAEIDLSQVIIVCTSNYKYNIQSTLLDRLEIIDFPGYTRVEKYHIAKRHLLPKQLEESGLVEYGIEIEDEALWKIIDQYTREAGVRNLERTIADVLRSRAVKIAEGKEYEKQVKASELQEILGPVHFEESACLPDDTPPGVATGLAYTPSGGCTLIVESCKMPKAREVSELQITGQLGGVMTESAQVAFSCARGYLTNKGVDLSRLGDFDYHIHFDEHGIGKEGPSAGAIMTLVFISLLTGRRVRTDFAMTGEIDLKGRVMPIGGVKQKLLAAHQAGYRNIFIPEQNKKDLPEIPDEIKKDLNIMLAKRIDDVVEFALL
ncbi:endopeptidase La [Patescibacteria group bacterium]|nr:endopeptidase La [Patescibacteria group bacterium]